MQERSDIYTRVARVAFEPEQSSGIGACPYFQRFTYKFHESGTAY